MIKIVFCAFSRSDPEQQKASDFPPTKSDPSDYEYFDQAGLSVKHSYQFVNDGPSTLPDATIEIKWPEKTSNKQWLLYLKSEPMVIDTPRGIEN